MTASASTADAVIVGAGVIGCSIALELSKQGMQVVVIDKSGGPGYGSTSASSAIVRFHYSTHEGVVAAWESKHCWDMWEDHLRFRDPIGLASFRRTGMVLLDTPVMSREHITSLFDVVGVPFEEWDSATLRMRIPGIDSGVYWPPKPVDDDQFFTEAANELGALYTPDAGFINDPQLAAHNLAAAAQHHGATLTFNRVVTSVAQIHDRVSSVTLSDGARISSPVLINAAGPWSGKFNRLAGVGAEFNIHVRPMRQEVHQVLAPGDFNQSDQLGPAIADLDLGIYLRPTVAEHLLIGGTEPRCDPDDWVDDPDHANPRATAGRFKAQVTRAARRLPMLRVPNSPLGIAGIYDVTDDWAPIYDKTDLGGFYVAIGTSGNQFKNAPLVGRLMATIIGGVEAGVDHDREPLRYACPHTGHVINLGSFSRKRAVNPDSSGTVMG